MKLFTKHLNEVGETYLKHAASAGCIAFKCKLNIPWDDDAEFMRWTKEVVEKSHLDDMTGKELKKVYKALEERGAENK